MLYELKTYTLKPRTVPEVEGLFAEAMPERGRYSRLGAAFSTDLGELNQVVRIWLYDDLAHYERVHALATADAWPPAIADHVVEERVELMESAPFMSNWDGPREWGGVYELRTYDLTPEGRGPVLEAWASKIEARVAYSPLVGCWLSAGTGGTQLRLYHLWAYADMDARRRIRAETQRLGVWPTGSGRYYVRQETKILIPAPYSPLH